MKYYFFEMCISGHHQMGSLNFGGGYDVVLPAGWSMAFWIAFVYRGARVGGARELATCSREQGVPHFPCDFPDTQAGREYNAERKRLGEEKYARYPPAKRPNYRKFGMPSPFAPDWVTLINEWSDQVGRLESNMKKVLGSCEAPIIDDSSGPLNFSETGNDEDQAVVASTGLSTKDSEMQEINRLKQGSEEGAGCLKDTEGLDGDNPRTLSSDLQECSKGENREDKDSNAVAMEAVFQNGSSETFDLDTNLQFNVIRTLSTRQRLQDVILGLNHSKKKRPQSNKISNEEIIKYLTKTIAISRRSLLCLNLRPLMKGSPQENAVIYIPTSKDLIQLQRNKSYGGPVEKVHKCNNRSSSVIGQSSRDAIGWVTSGEFSFARGQGSAIGFCTFPGFCELITRTLREWCNPVVLVRNTSTFQYRFADITVV